MVAHFSLYFMALSFGFFAAGAASSAVCAVCAASAAARRGLLRAGLFSGGFSASALAAGDVGAVGSTGPGPGAGTSAGFCVRA